MVDKKTGFQNHKAFRVVLWAMLIVIALLIGFILAVIIEGKSDQATRVGSNISVSDTMEATTPVLPAEPKGVAQEAVVNLSGKWTTTINGTIFDVQVDDGGFREGVGTTITIKMVNNGATMLYWYGSFSSTTSMGKTITSDKLDIDKAVLSGAPSKNFVVGDGTLTFEVSAMGKTRDVEVRHVA